MTKFKIGDKVICIKEYNIEDGLIKVGLKGVVVHIHQLKPNIGIEWEEKPRNGHYCQNHCKQGYGYYVEEENVKLISNTLKSLLE